MWPLLECILMGDPGKKKRRRIGEREIERKRGWETKKGWEAEITREKNHM